MKFYGEILLDAVKRESNHAVERVILKKNLVMKGGEIKPAHTYVEESKVYQIEGEEVLAVVNIGSAAEILKNMKDI